ncbi:MFS transporter [Natronosporangium hydrolyticum]|uniref:MFS transporter n=1 Tax=Natronosporangium hydrolyticum TaxID=2811111 RepID=A0A895YHE8_9ACTN|nr:MFS transporter [Natronosporangium hydrolyticum]QSB17267.1 MFS transporter [Natronosporangium hydrolyticum]
MDEEPNTGHPQRWLILGVLVVCLLVVVLDHTILNVALKVIADPVQGLGATQVELEWALNSYTLVFAGLLFMFGVVADRYGRRLFLVIGLVIFGIASVASAYAQDPGQLIAARALMGIGGAAIMPATLSIISTVFDPRERGRAIGVWAGAVGIGVAIGPVTGGLLLEHFWWGSIFLVNAPVVVLGLVLILSLVPESRDPNPSRLDVVGVLLSIAGLVALVYGIIDGGEHGFGRPMAWLTIGGGVALLTIFVLWERRISYPSLDIRLFRNPRFSTAAGVVALIFFAAFGVLFFVIFFLQLVRDYSPLQAGLLLMPFAVAQLIFAPLSATMVKRFGAKAVCAVGLSLTAGALLGWVFIGEQTPIWVVCVLFFVQGIGMANVMPPATESILSTLPRERAGVGSAVTNTVRQVGGALGVAVLGAVVMAVYRRLIEPTLATVPEEVRGEAGESISGAYAVIEREGLTELVAPANEAFVTAMHTAATVSAVVAVISVLVVLRWLPGRERPGSVPEPRRDSALATAGSGNRDSVE